MVGEHLLYVVDIEELALAYPLLKVAPGSKADLALSRKKPAVRVLARFQDANASCRFRLTREAAPRDILQRLL